MAWLPYEFVKHGPLGIQIQLQHTGVCATEHTSDLPTQTTIDYRHTRLTNDKMGSVSVRERRTQLNNA
jgi:hypothetical protein